MAAVLAAGLLIAIGPGGCGKDAAKPVAQPRGLLPDPSAAGDEYGSTEKGPPSPGSEPYHADLAPKRPKRHRKNRRRPKHDPPRRLVEQSSTPRTPTRRYAPATRSTRRYYYSAPRRSYVAPPTHYTPAPEPPHGAPEFL